MDIIKSAGSYLKEGVIYITLEPEDYHYQNTVNTQKDIDSYMQNIGFIKYDSDTTDDPTYFNPDYSDYIKENEIKIYQRS